MGLSAAMHKVFLFMSSTSVSSVLPGILEATPDMLSKEILEAGFPRFRAQQVREWIFANRTCSLERMSNVPAALKKKLQETYSWALPQVVHALHSEDGTTKLLLRGHDGRVFETVIMRYPKRTTICVSSEIGCKLACSFCQTGKLGFFRHLTAHEIVAQFQIAQTFLPDRKITHVVFMGMGEPFLNYDAVLRATNLFISPEAYGLSARRVTVSTSGIADRIIDFSRDSTARLAISLHAAREEVRTSLMPINRKYPLAELKNALLHYQKVTEQKITIEYILIQGVNMTQADAKALVQFLQGLRAKVNLIPFNAHPGLGYERAEESEILAFQQYLTSRSIPAPVRYSRGLDVSGGCGQLAAKTEGQVDAVPLRKNVVV